MRSGSAQRLPATSRSPPSPAGLCSRRIKGSVCDLPWKPSFVKNAIESRRDIVPVYFEGKLSNFFYNLSSIRTALGIKANIEMLYLADEMFSQRGRHFDIYFGEPVPWQRLTTGEPPSGWHSKSVNRPMRCVRHTDRSPGPARHHSPAPSPSSLQTS